MLASISRRVVTKMTVPKLPNEVLVNIAECCDLQTILNPRLVDRATKQLIDTFENQIVEKIAYLLDPDYAKGSLDIEPYLQDTP
jgi:hypothetical protein